MSRRVNNNWFRCQLGLDSKMEFMEPFLVQRSKLWHQRPRWQTWQLGCLFIQGCKSTFSSLQIMQVCPVDHEIAKKLGRHEFYGLLQGGAWFQATYQSLRMIPYFKSWTQWELFPGLLIYQFIDSLDFYPPCIWPLRSILRHQGLEEGPLKGGFYGNLLSTFISLFLGAIKPLPKKATRNVTMAALLIEEVTRTLANE